MVLFKIDPNYEKTVSWVPFNDELVAEEQFKIILINDRDYVDPAAQLMMAKSQLKQNNYEGALRTCKSFLTSYPKSIYESDGLILLGDISLKNEKFAILQ